MEVAAIYSEKTVTDILNIVHHPGYSVMELTSITISLKVCHDVTICIADACKNRT